MIIKLIFLYGNFLLDDIFWLNYFVKNTHRVVYKLTLISPRFALRLKLESYEGDQAMKEIYISDKGREVK